MKEKDIQRKIMELVATEPVAGIRKKQLFTELAYIDEDQLRTQFRRLVENGEILRKRGGLFCLPESKGLLTGSFARNPAGFGFVTLDRDGSTIFIPPDSTQGAISGDKVQCRLTEKSAKGPSGEIVRILERGKDTFVGCIDTERGEYVIHPMRRDLPSSIMLEMDDAGEAIISRCKMGDWVTAKLLPSGNAYATFKAQLITSLGRGNTIAGMLKAISKEYGLAEKYSQATEDNALKIQPLELPREDCTQLLTFTIDPADAKDFDDAISFQLEKDGTATIGVHIADVACYVRPNTPLDRAARKRGFTSYLPGKTVGMLPFALSNELCSLKQDCDRLAHSVFMHVSPKGKVLSSRRVHTIICSKKRLTFDQVEKVLDGESDATVPTELRDTLVQVWAFASKMREHRANTEVFLPFSPKEVRVLCGGNPPHITGISTSQKESKSSNLVEELMLAANVCVALEMKQKCLPALYRNHSQPNEDDLREITPTIMDIMDIKPPKFHNRVNFAAFLAQLAEEPNADAIIMGLLRCMPRAMYGASSEGHYALGKETYCHFTSPIRRYPDLLVHQQLITLDTGEKHRTQEEMAEMAQICNANEVNCDQAYFAASDRLKIKYIMDSFRKNRGSYLECTILRFAASGISLYISQYALMAFMTYDQLPGCRGKENVKNGTLRFDHGKRSYTIGNTLFAQPLRVDDIAGEMLLRPMRTFI